MSMNFPQNYTDLAAFMGDYTSLNGLAGVWPNTPAATYGNSSGPIVKSQKTMYQLVEQRLAGSGGGSGLIALLPTVLSLSALQGIDSALSGAKQALVQDAQQVLIKRVNSDNPQPDQSLQTAMIEWIRQMQVQSLTVQNATVAAVVTAGASNTGTPVVYMSLLDPNGLTLENCYAENLRMICTTDANHGATAGSETLTLTSPQQVSPTDSYAWPAGSGVNASVIIVDPTLGNGSGTNANLLTGSTGTTTGAFKNATLITTQWTVTSGPTLLSDGTTQAYGPATDLTHCLKIAGDGASTVTLYQSFANGGITTGSTATILPGTVYHLSVHVKASPVPAAGRITFSLVDGSNVVINNNAGVPNTITTILSSYGGITYQTITGAFETPTVLPSAVRLQITTPTVISNLTNVYIDFPALVQPNSNGPTLVGSGGSSSGYGGLYAGGPYLTVFRGSADVINWVSPTIGDQWTINVANNYGSNSPTIFSFQSLFWAFFGMPGMGLILPSAASPSITVAIP